MSEPDQKEVDKVDDEISSETSLQPTYKWAAIILQWMIDNVDKYFYSFEWKKTKLYMNILKRDGSGGMGTDIAEFMDVFGKDLRDIKSTSEFHIRMWTTRINATMHYLNEKEKK